MSDQQPYDEIFNASDASYSPPEVSAYGLQAIIDIRDKKDRALPVGINGLDDYVAPIRPGQVAGVVGQTSHYKSGFLHLLEHSAALQLSKQGRDGECIIHVSVEECIEEQAFLEFARDGEEDAGHLANGDVRDWDRLVGVAYEVAQVPIFRIGDSLKRSDRIQPMHLTNVTRAVQYIKEQFRMQPAMISIDYLQALPVDTEYRHMEDDTQRRLQVRRDAYRCRQMSVMFECPVWVACQAKQMLGSMSTGVGRGSPLLIPGTYDINESADVAQRFDRLLATWLPYRSYPLGTVLKVGGEEIHVAPNLLFIKVNKQRGGLPSGRLFQCTVDFLTNAITVEAEYD